MEQSKEKDMVADSESFVLVQAIMDDKNILASKKLEKILKQKAAKRISDVLDN